MCKKNESSSVNVILAFEKENTTNIKNYLMFEEGENLCFTNEIKRKFSKNVMSLLRKNIKIDQRIFNLILESNTNLYIFLDESYQKRTLKRLVIDIGNYIVIIKFN